jgi:hypothetical protein
MFPPVPLFPSVPYSLLPFFRLTEVCQTFLSHRHCTLAAILVPLLIVEGSNLSVWSISNVYGARAPVLSPYAVENEETSWGIESQDKSIPTGVETIGC